MGLLTSPNSRSPDPYQREHQAVLKKKSVSGRAGGFKNTQPAGRDFFFIFFFFHFFSLFYFPFPSVKDWSSIKGGGGLQNGKGVGGWGGRGK